MTWLILSGALGLEASRTNASVSSPMLSWLAPMPSSRWKAEKTFDPVSGAQKTLRALAHTRKVGTDPPKTTHGPPNLFGWGCEFKRERSIRPAQCTEQCTRAARRAGKRRGGPVDTPPDSDPSSESLETESGEASILDCGK